MTEEFRYGPNAYRIFGSLIGMVPVFFIWALMADNLAIMGWYVGSLLFFGFFFKRLINRFGLYDMFNFLRASVDEARYAKRNAQKDQEVTRRQRNNRYRNQRYKDERLPKNW